jgi:hypothetical protein
MFIHIRSLAAYASQSAESQASGLNGFSNHVHTMDFYLTVFIS